MRLLPFHAKFSHIIEMAYSVPQCGNEIKHMIFSRCWIVALESILQQQRHAADKLVEASKTAQTAQFVRVVLRLRPEGNQRAFDWLKYLDRLSNGSCGPV